MGMQTDVKAASLAASGSVFGDRTRVRGLVIEPSATAGTVVLRNGGVGGAVVMTFNTPANAAPYSVLLPGEGVLFSTNVYAALTNAKATVFYG